MTPNDADRIDLRRTPPERKRPVGSVVLAGPGCCCCCCCCLHSVGSLIGSLVAAREPRPGPDDLRRVAAEPTGPDVSVARLYWWVVFLILLLGFFTPVLGPWGYWYYNRGPIEVFFSGGGAVLVMAIGFLPLVQLGASVVALFVILLGFHDRGPALRRLGWITLGSVLGTLAGLLAMAPFLLPCLG